MLCKGSCFQTNKKSCNFLLNFAFQQYLNNIIQMATKTFLILCYLLSLLLVISRSQLLYNWNPTSMRNQTWMAALDYGLPLREMSIVGTQNSVVFDSCFFITATTQERQANSLQVQLESGIRAIDIHVKHLNNQFQISDRGCAQGTSFNQVLTTVKNFLTIYPSQTVIMRLVEEVSASGCSRTFQDTFISYRDAFAGLFWMPTTQDPQLGEVRGRLVLLQDFTSVTIHGMLMATFSILPNKYFSSNWVLYDKWLEIKNFLPGVNAAKKSKIMFWTGHGASYPYFVASGKSDPTGPRLWTGMLTPAFKNSCPDFPRVNCVIGICSIFFEGMNIMGYNFIVKNNYAYTGIVYVNLYGDDLVRMVLGKNTAVYAKCSSTKVSQGCTLCQLGTGICLKCNTNLNYVYDTVNKICLAKVGYYLDPAYVPQLCSLAEIGCLECTSATVCTKCDVLLHYLLSGGQCIAQPGYYLNGASIPTPCPQVGCAECSDQFICTLCSAPLKYIMDPNTGNTCKCDDTALFMPSPTTEACICMPSYFLSSLGTCDPMPTCPDMFPTKGGCTNCITDPITNIIQCDTCEVASNYVLDPVLKYCKCAPAFYFDGTACLSCTVADPACDDCVSASLCLSCVDNFTLTAGVCKCNFQHYLVDPDTCNLCATGCLICTNLVTCTLCDATKNFQLVNGLCECIPGMYLNGGICQPCNTMAGCVDCNTAGCTLCDAIFGFLLDINKKCVCDYGFFINDMKICEQCTATGCLNCLNQAQCIECDTSLYYLAPNATCDDKCGDGFRIYVDCDDGNLIDGDGCSSLCKVQQDYKCTGGSITSKDTCSYSGLIQLTVIKTVKDQKQNRVFMQIIIKPSLQSLAGIDFSVAINPKFPYETKTATFDTNKSQINFEFTYNQSLNHLTSNDLNITFQPPNSVPEYFYMKPSSVTMPEVTDNNLALKYYDPEIYNLLDLMKTLTEITAFLYIGVSLICFLFLSKLIAIELILVPQIAFAGLIMIQKIQALLQPLNNFKLTNGLNSLFTDTIQLPPRLLILFYQGEFLSNFNICFAVITIPAIVGLLIMLVAKIKKSKQLFTYSYRTMKEWAFSVVLLFQFHFTVTFGIDFLYGNTIIGKALGGVLFAGLICFIVLMYKRPLNFGEFKTCFQDTPLSLNHYAFVVFFRVLLALNLIILSANQACGFVALGITGLYTLFLIITRPYQKNVRPILNMAVILAILSVESVYKLNFYSAQSTFITNYLPLFIVGLLLVLLLVNVIFMILEVMERFKKNKIDEYQKNEDESLDFEMKRELDKQMEMVSTIQMALNPSKMQEKQKLESAKDSQLEKGLNELKDKYASQSQKGILLVATPTNMTEKDKLIYTEI